MRSTYNCTELHGTALRGSDGTARHCTAVTALHGTAYNTTTMYPNIKSTDIVIILCIFLLITNHDRQSTISRKEDYGYDSFFLLSTKHYKPTVWLF